ncbi:glycine/betaine ABC transporter [Clostridium bowmanii]|uniref:glycine betaine ABC transporter substrate-binding protein n=1 Tax=Clostridium bowmanii TaxID=132925 RepID=UPI001C0AA5EC|nr:glycine betaine ABC transporter substrate-binding protein [Clostridium bowmanii]MBU3191190.1 glycine/betaine ABC transporter [Clostridium bowmanii]MCA1075638.1 glycine/betaine ABC transporter [Clostridium bowmanii]
MIKNSWKRLSIVAFSLVALTFVGCGNKSGDKAPKAGKTIGDKMDYKITGIDAGSGVVQASEQVVKDYKLDYTVQTSSGAAMTQALADAYKNKEPIVITGWSPHWMFSKYDLKYLKDPKGSFGAAEHIDTVVHKGLKESMPDAYKILDQFVWTPKDSESVMLKINAGGDAKKIARQWITDNKDKVSKWTEGTKKADGKEIKLAYVAWDTEIASTNVIALALEDMGYKVRLTQVDAGPMWAAVASGDADAIVAAWLPKTHAKFMSDYKGKVENLGPNLEGAKIGLVVPSYMKIDSIEDLTKK